MAQRRKSGSRTGAGRTTATRTGAPAQELPIHIRATGVPVDASDRVYLRSKLAVKLGKFGRAIARASVRIADANGPRGGADKACTIKVVLVHEPSVVVVQQHVSLKTAMDAAMQRAVYAVRRALKRRSDSRKSPAAGSMA